MAITVHQTKYAGRQRNVSSIDVTFDTNPTAGRAVIAVSWHYNGATGNLIDSVTDNQSNAYTQAAQANIGFAADLVQVAIYHCLNITASGTFTVTANYLGSASSNANIAVMEVSGLLTSGALDQTGSATGSSSSSDASVSTSGATTQADEVVVAGCCLYSTEASAAITLASYTNFGLENDGTSYLYPPGSADYQIVATTGTQTASYSHNNTGQSGWVAAIATYKSLLASGTALDFGRRIYILP